MPLTELTDEDLCALSQSGRTEAEQILAQRYMASVRSVIRPYFLIGGDSEDLLQEGMIALLLAIRQYSPERDASFRTFSDHCIRNRVRNVIKAAARYKHKPLDNYLSLTDDGLDGTPTTLSINGPEDEIISRETERELLISLEALLSPLENQILQLYLTGLTYCDIAEHTGKSAKAVDNAIQRIRKKLTAFPLAPLAQP